jgi:uncharacterized protein (TIGR03437 family)
MKKLKWFWTITISSLIGLPILLFAYSSGAPSRSTGAPGDNTCLRGGCHVGTRTDDSSSLEILWEGGQSYEPGRKQRFTVRIGATGRRYGFQASARLNSSEINGQAGTFTPIDTRTYVLCETVDPRPTIGCPPNNPVEFITHFDASTSNTFQFDWTPPAAASAGPVTIYVAANSSDGPAPNGAKIHLKKLVLQPGTGGGLPPTISSGGVVSASAFGGGTTVAPGSWIEIFGANFSTVTRGWEGRDFNGNAAPTNLENVQVSVDGKAAAVAFVSPSQVNVQVPDAIAQGPVAVRVRTPGGETAAAMITGAARAPGILAPASFVSTTGRRYVGALFPDGTTFVGPTNLVPGASFRGARPGERVLVYGVGFGPTTPAIPSGQIVTATNSISGLQVRIGDQPVTVEYGGLSPNFVGLYQFNLVVPNLAAGDYPIVMTVGSITTQSNLFFTVAAN